MSEKKELWFDARDLIKEDTTKILPVIFNHGFDGVMITVGQSDMVDTWPRKIKLLLFIEKENAKDILDCINKYKEQRAIIVFSRNEKILKDEAFHDVERGIFSSVDDKESMEKVIALSEDYKNCIIEFSSDTNIPLELILAHSQKNQSKICKKVNHSDDGWIATMTMEMGSYAVLLQTNDINDIINLKLKLDKLENISLLIEELTVKEVKHVGMGDRVCIDTTSNLNKDEGMIIGSTSNGGILVSSETHFLPYMDLRPFRVNAGALHSYVWCSGNTTKYLSELKAGEEVLAVNSKGISRVVTVGRVKMERRPMLLIKAESSSGVSVNAFVQDDWHIRVISANGEVKNSTYLKDGDIVLGYITKPGRHIGVEINESIVEE
ncbi:MAG TPA: 3-dehydroquinate synthase II [Bacillota bacterium]|nr:3-dehydroquinate synthase II [Bacillota bacterium]